MSPYFTKTHTPSESRYLLAVVLTLITLCTGCVSWSWADESSPAVKILVTYHSLSGNTERMAEAVAAGAKLVSDTQIVLKRVGQVTADDLFSADAVVVGSPVYWSNMSGEVKTFFDNWQFKFGVFPEFKMKNKVGAAFTTGGANLKRERDYDVDHPRRDAGESDDCGERWWSLWSVGHNRGCESGNR